MAVSVESGDEQDRERMVLVTERAAAVFDRWTGLIAQRFIADGIQADQADELAVLATAALEGAILQARAAHLAATDAVRTPEQAHARCMAALARHPTAITPRHYVICRTAPSDPADRTAWPAPLATGTGRA